MVDKKRVTVFMCGCTSANSAVIIALLREMKEKGLLSEKNLAAIFSEARANLQPVPDMPEAMRAGEIWLEHLERKAKEPLPAKH